MDFMAVTEEKKKILLIGDDEIHLSAAANILTSEYEISTAKSVTEALLLLYKGFIPNLILFDNIMSQIEEGWSTYNRIKAITLLHEIPITFFASLNDKNEIEHAHIIGPADYITKPYEAEELLKWAAAIINR